MLAAQGNMLSAALLTTGIREKVILHRERLESPLHAQEQLCHSLAGVSETDIRVQPCAPCLNSRYDL